MQESINPDDRSRADDEESEQGSATISYLCMKYNRHQQGNDLACQDPDLYCKYRTSCLIHFMEKENRRNNKHNETSGE